MADWTLGYGALLTTLGVGGFVVTGAQHRTALIPAGLGSAVCGLDLLMRRKGYWRAAQQGALFMGLLGLLGAARGLVRLPALLQGRLVGHSAVVVTQSFMAVLSAAYVTIGLRQLLHAPERCL